ncbi:MAG: hypothetical protein L0Z62_34180 [Gemmataceae bacterium]|nr:hypothetical protein [Gemmataceae bacterium]
MSLIPVLVCCRGWRFLVAFRFQLAHNAQGHSSAFLLGEVSPGGFWHYFPMAVLIKVGLPVLLLALVVLAARPRGLANGPFLAGLALLALSPLYRVQIGVRFVLPAVALLLIGVGVATARWLQTLRARSRLTWAGVGAALCWSVAGAVQVWPQGICFTNELWGGTGKGYLALSDSNYDWGQGLRELARWQRRHCRAPLDIWYFGTDPALKRLPMRRVDLAPLASGEELLAREQGRYLAVSTTHLHGQLSDTPLVRFLQGRQPMARTTMFVIYDFTGEQPSPLPPRSSRNKETDT